MANDLWQDALSFLTKNIKEYAILVVLFLIVLAVIYSIASGLSSVFLIFYAGTIGFAISSIIIFSLWGLLYAFVTGAYLFALKDSITSLNKGAQLDYIGSIATGFKTMMRNSKMTSIVLIMGLVSGLIYGSFNALSNYALLVVGQIFSGVVYAGVVLFLLSTVYGLDMFKLFEKIKNINTISPNAGLFLVLTILLPIIPIVGALEIFLLAFTMVILSKSVGQSPAAAKK